MKLFAGLKALLRRTFLSGSGVEASLNGRRKAPAVPASVSVTAIEGATPLPKSERIPVIAFEFNTPDDAIFHFDLGTSSSRSGRIQLTDIVGKPAEAYEGVQFRTSKSEIVAVIFKNRGHGDLLITTPRNGELHRSAITVNSDRIEVSPQFFDVLIAYLDGVDRSKVRLNLLGLDRRYVAPRNADLERRRRVERDRRDDEDRRLRDEEDHFYRTDTWRSEPDVQPTFKGAGGSSGGAGASGSWEDTPNDVAARQALAGIGYVIGSGMLNPKNDPSSETSGNASTGTEIPGGGEAWRTGSEFGNRDGWNSGSDDTKRDDEISNSGNWSNPAPTEDRSNDYVPSGGGYDR